MSAGGARHARMLPAPLSFRETLDALGTAQKAVAAGAPPYSVFINRRAGRYVAAAAYRRGMTPNQVTAIGAVLTFGGIVLLALAAPSWPAGILIWAALAVGYVFDSADGQVARLSGGGSLSGEWLDHVLDSLKISSLHLAVLITAYVHFRLPDIWMLVPIGYTIVAAVSFFSMILNDQLKRGFVIELAKQVQGRRRILRSILLLPTDYGVLCLIFLTLGTPVIFFAVYAFFFIANAGHLGLACVKWFRDMQELSMNNRSHAGSFK